MTTADTSHVEPATLTAYAANGLREGERAAVVRHLERCATCRAEAEAAVRLRTDVARAFATEPGPSARARREVLARITASHTSRDAFARAAARLKRWLRAPSVPGWAMTMVLLLAIVQAGVLLAPERSRPSVDVTPRSVAPRATRLRIGFQPSATEVQIRELLGSLDARVVDGPHPDGTYLVELGSTDSKSAADALSAARARGDVLRSIAVVP
jgi:hypothetical protein